MPNPNPIEANSPTVSPFPKDCTVHIPYTDAKTFADVVLLNHVGEKEFKSIVGDGIGVLTKKKIKKNDMGLSKEVMEKEDAWSYSTFSSKSEFPPPYLTQKTINLSQIREDCSRAEEDALI
ncbi:hypothetical protein Tco_0517351 [Tanacetum coccineum]